MTGGTGAVPAGCGGARLASRAEPDSGAGTAHPWPLQTRLPLAALPTAPACARGHVRTISHEWGLHHLADTAELLASELVTNAVQASQRPGMSADLAVVPVVLLWVTSNKASIVIHVWDGSDEMPARRSAMPDEEGGRGLMLVEALGKDWGTYGMDDGKVVWVQITGEP